MRALLLPVLITSAALAQAPAGPAAAPAEPQAAAVPPVEPAVDAGLAVSAEAETDDSDATPEGVDGEATEAEGSEAEGLGTACAGDGGVLYSADVSDEELQRRFVEDLSSLGSISVGLAEAGRVINGVQLEPGEAWQLVTPENAWGTEETVSGLKLVAQYVHDRVPTAPPLRVNHIGKKEGGYLRPHQSHQSGRDVDLGFYYQAGVDLQAMKTSREKSIDLAANWALVRALATEVDVQFILVDRRIQKVLYDYALAHGEDRAWLDSLFHAGADSLVRHARRHRDHFHVRFFAPRSQELGRRVQPMLAKRPEENLVIHRVKKGDTLGGLAAKYGSTVKLIQKANGLSTSMLRVGRTLNIPLRGPCNNCPLPPPLVVPARRLPPTKHEACAPTGATSHTG